MDQALQVTLKVRNQPTRPYKSVLRLTIIRSLLMPCPCNVKGQEPAYQVSTEVNHYKVTIKGHYYLWVLIFLGLLCINFGISLAPSY